MRALVLIALAVLVNVVFFQTLVTNEPALPPLAGISTITVPLVPVGGSSLALPTPIGTPAPTVAPVIGALPGGCTAVAPVAAPHGHTLEVAALPLVCGCPPSQTTPSAARWHGHLLAHAVRLTGQCSVAVFNLGGHFSALHATLYLDDATGTQGGIFGLYTTATPTDPNSYLALYQTNIGYAANGAIPIATSMRGVGYLVLWERCCTGQNTVFALTGRVS